MSILLTDVEKAEILEDWDFIEFDRKYTIDRLCKAQLRNVVKWLRANNVADVNGLSGDCLVLASDDWQALKKEAEWLNDGWSKSLEV